MVVCTKCKMDKPEEQFFKDPRKRNGLCSHCKQCRYKDKIKRRKPRITPQGEYRAKRLAKLRNITPEEWHDMIWNKNMFAADIAKLLGYNSPQSILRYIKANNIPYRSLQESAILRNDKYKYPHPFGENHPMWRGGRSKDKRGYIILGFPKANGGKATKAFEHRYVWEQHHGKKIPKGYVIHHLNGIKDDNRPENLVAVKPKDHERWTYVKALQSRIRQLEQLHLLI